MKLKDFDFRVWDNHNKKYIDNIPYSIKKYQNENEVFLPFSTDLREYGFNETFKNEIQIPSDRVEVELWTGLYDKFGKKIYEGDIVRYFECEILVIKFRYGVFMACPDYDEFLKKFEYDKNDEGVKENWLEMSYKLYRQARNG
ncbi:hypothetical protein KJQ85_08070, partial [Campylobacter lari]|uniref:YopX family protein n=1 Tax=Campylobacter lari TaxID=201 RepID=UPI001BD9826D